jgi:hypothetical protein
MPAKSRQQEKFIMANPGKFGGKAKAKKEWLDPVKGKKLPKKVKSGKAKGK